MDNAIKKIVVIGPESTGKSTLCSMLAKHFNTVWVKEYAREYLLENSTNYNFDDLLTIAKGQIHLEEMETKKLIHSKKSILFLDTDMQVMKVWCEYVFEKCHNWILNKIAERPYNLYLLCNTDLPWVKDSLREYPDLESREKLYQHYKQAMVSQNIPWVSISGKYDERLATAIEAVNKYI